MTDVDKIVAAMLTTAVHRETASIDGVFATYQAILNKLHASPDADEAEAEPFRVDVDLGDEDPGT